MSTAVTNRAINTKLLDDLNSDLYMISRFLELKVLYLGKTESGLALRFNEYNSADGLYIYQYNAKTLNRDNISSDKKSDDLTGQQIIINKTKYILRKAS